MGKKTNLRGIYNLPGYQLETLHGGIPAAACSKQAACCKTPAIQLFCSDCTYASPPNSIESYVNNQKSTLKKKMRKGGKKNRGKQLFLFSN